MVATMTLRCARPVRIAEVDEMTVAADEMTAEVDEMTAEVDEMIVAADEMTAEVVAARGPMFPLMDRLRFRSWSPRASRSPRRARPLWTC